MIWSAYLFAALAFYVSLLSQNYNGPRSVQVIVGAVISLAWPFVSLVFLFQALEKARR